MKKRLLSPGPCDVPPEVLLAGAAPQVHHRTPLFRNAYQRMLELIKPVFRTTRPVFPLCATGSGAMECAVANLTSPGERPIVVNGGWFGKRWNDICLAYGMETDVIEVPWGEAVDPAVVRTRLAANPAAPAVFVQLSETSTGAIHPIRELQDVCSATGALLVIDGISGVGAHECETDAWGLDCVLTGSQKSLMIPPGLAYITVADRAWERIERTRHPRFYFDLRKSRKGYEQMEHPFTPPTSLVQSQVKALELLAAEGLDVTIRRHARLAEATRRAARGMGLELFARAPGNVCTSIVMPQGLDSGVLVKKLRDEHGISIAGAQGPWKGKFFRIGHLGYVDDNDIVAVIGALERVLNEIGIRIPFGSGVAPALEYLHAIRTGQQEEEA